MNQLALSFPSLHAAKQAGDRLSILCTAKATRSDPDFSDKAKAAILAHLRIVGQCSGEDLVELCNAKGIVPANGNKAFGAVFQGLLRTKQVRVAAIIPRRHGHGSLGAKLYEIA